MRCPLVALALLVAIAVEAPSVWAESVEVPPASSRSAEIPAASAPMVEVTPPSVEVPTPPSVEEARARVEHHLREADQIIRHFEDAASAECPRFASPGEWSRYFDGEVDRVTLLVAHVEQAWVEAKRVGDDDVRRAAKAPRRRLGEARGEIGKLRGCAADNGAKVSLLAVWSRIERDVPSRQAAIALPR
jgi:hypothetical protein